MKILVADDDPENIKLMSVILKNYGYGFSTARDGVETLSKASETMPDLIFLDVMMPGMDGYEVCRRLKENPATKNIPIVMVTSLSDRDARIKGLEAGANDFIIKPIDSAEIMTRARNLLKMKEYEDLLKSYSERLEADVMERTAQLNKAFEELSVSRDKLREGYHDTIHRLTRVAEYKDEDTAVHIKRTSHYCLVIAKNLGWSEEAQDLIFYASPMHDIGKVGVPLEILLKPGKLTPEEFSLMKTHTLIGVRILRGSVSAYIKKAERIAAGHHERWDGGGYPAGLRGEDIPEEGRIMNLADQYDALRSPRPYKPAFDHERTFKILTEGDGRTMPSHFDPRVLAVFKDAHSDFERIYEEAQRQEK